MSKFVPDGSFELSPITRGGSPIMGRIGSAVTEDGKVIHGSYQIDAKDVIELLEWLDHKAPMFNSTNKLWESYKDMRASLHEIWEAIQ